jgi:hypothetical protein
MLVGLALSCGSCVFGAVGVENWDKGWPFLAGGVLGGVVCFAVLVFGSELDNGHYTYRQPSAEPEEEMMNQPWKWGSQIHGCGS